MKPEPSATVEEAAAIVGCDPEALKATIDRYNELVAKGVDEDFGKDITKMTAIEPPYYVYEGHPGNMLVLMAALPATTIAALWTPKALPSPAFTSLATTKAADSEPSIR